MSQITLAPGIGPSIIGSLRRKVRADLLSNWRLSLLGLTGLVLSVASGWTTYDGMTNFTKTPVLSFMITFGIQGVMLVMAWLIGESFATGATGETEGRGPSIAGFLEILQKAFQLFVTIVVLGTIGYLIGRFILGYDTNAILTEISQTIYTIIWVLGGILAFALMLVLFSRAEIIGPYARGARVILSHLPLWIMFLTCMATSVFFSFDSLFSTIFPAEERQRAGELRAQGQISGIVADIDAQIKKRRRAASKTLFASTPWTSYENRIGQLVQLVRTAPGAIEAQLVAKLKDRQTLLAKEREAFSSAKALQRNLAIEEEQLTVSVKRLEVQRPELEGELDRLTSELRAKQQEIATRRAEAEAEAKGVSGTGKAGRGPKFRQLQKFVTKTQIEIRAIESQVKIEQKALALLDSRRARERARLLEIAQKLAKFKSQEQAAAEGIKVQESLRKGGPDANFDATGGLKVLEKELAKFRQQPTRQTLGNVEQICGGLVRTLHEVPKLKTLMGGLDCETGPVNEIAGRVFALNADLKQFQSQCGKGAGIPSDSTDGLLKFAQQCILASGLAGTDTQTYRSSLNRIALNRDDKAHRFVVTWNAFVDGNRLAHLALAIAIAIDGLVFMSGLFGANAIVSPLAESPRARNRTISQLHEIIDNALLPETAYNCELVLNLMYPRSDTDQSGYIASVDLSDIKLDQALLVRNVLTAGASLGLVTHVEEQANQYLIRSELFEYISSVRAREARLGNLNVTPAVPKYAAEGEKTLPKPEKKIPPKIENKRSGILLLDIDETKRRYIHGLFNDLHFDHIDEQFLETLIIEHNRIEGALKKLFRTEPQIEKLLLRKESDVAREIESAHERLMNSWINDPDTDYQVSRIKRQEIKSAIILGQKLPHLRDDLQREIENAQLRTLSDPEAEYYDCLEQGRQAIDRFFESNGQDVTAAELISELDAFKSVTKPI
ncbi:hypothetical protein MnTg02_00834 [bacterium MnTg02]|nr:hypothetical protein MnTg02_00834 [bacterium MnTg02]